MPVLKDLECQRCGATTEATVEPTTEKAKMKCQRCGEVTKHKTLCNGGCGKRYRFMDWAGIMSDPDERGKHIQMGRPRAVTANEKTGEESPLMHRDGSTIDSKYDVEKGRARFDRKVWNEKKSRGRGKIYLT